MAIIDPWNQPHHGLLDTRTYEIRGVMVIAQYEVDDYSSLSPDAIKYQLANRLAEQMMKDKTIEFTKQKDVSSPFTQYRARCFVVPSGDVQILRTMRGPGA